MSLILVVDDVEENRDMLSRRLKRKGYDALVAEDGYRALELIEAENIDLVLLDIRMPGLNGNEVLEKIRAKYTAVDLPVIMVTAETDTDSELKSFGLGADDYITKPIEFKILLARLQNKLAMKELVNKNSLAEPVAGNGKSDEEFLLETIKKGESQILEFKSTLRWNIHAGKIGKEIETAWLKTIVAFLNTDGGTLLVGVEDDGSICGLEQDKFKSNDKLMLFVNSAISDRIGVEFVDSISHKLVEVDQNFVLRVDCKAISKPVFLKGEKDDDFYIRFGPGSRKLSTKEVLSYMQNKNL